MANTLTGKVKRSFECSKCGFSLLTSGKEGIIRCPKCGFHPNDEMEKKAYKLWVFGD